MLPQLPEWIDRGPVTVCIQTRRKAGLTFLAVERSPEAFDINFIES